ncbi:MAG: GAF domain-containing protein, partial [Chloroflexota bacterium]
MPVILFALVLVSVGASAYLWQIARREKASPAWALMALFATLFALTELTAEYLPPSFSAVTHTVEIISMSGLLAAALWLFRGERREMREALTAERGRERLAASLQRVGAAVTASLDLPTVLDAICSETCRLFDADVAVVFLLEDDGQILRPVSARGVSAEEILKQRIPLTDPVSVTARAARERRAVFINDLQHSSEGVPLL